MANVYKQKRAYYCLGEIYDHGRVFADAGRHLIQSEGALSVPGIPTSLMTEHASMGHVGPEN
ncbi:hypothetical protein [Burkholderia sp. 567]|uniref:hypothetical protein n=1 Tax=Burkholderia sp. 567 TaxID=3156413 RepID=UPI00339457B0